MKKTFGLLTVVLVLASSVLAQTPGFSVSAGGGMAWVNCDDFVVYHTLSNVPGGEPLSAIEKRDTIPVARLTAGYTFNEQWGVQLSYADYGTAEAKLALPTSYSDLIAGGAVYQRIVLKYDASSLSLMPTYAHALTDNIRIRGSAGINYSTASSRLDTTYTSGGVILDNAVRTASSPKVTYSQIWLCCFDRR